MIIDFFIKYGFVIELMIAVAILVYRQDKRSYFLIKVVSFALLLFIGTHIFVAYIPSTVLNAIFRHLLLYIIATMGIGLCFKLSLWPAIFFGTAALTIQHSAFKLGNLALIYMVQQGNQKIGLAMYIITIMIVYGFLFLYVGERLRDESGLSLKSNNKEIILTATTLILFSTVFQNLLDYYVDENNFRLVVVITSYDLISCILIFSIQFGILQSSKLQHDTKVMEHVLHLQKDQLENSKKSIEIINVKYHDLKHQLSNLDKKIDFEELESLKKAITVYDLYLETGNEALDVVLAEKRLLCEQLNIKINCMADGSKLNQIQATEVYALFGNAIDNAIYATKCLDRTEKRVINISVKELMGMVSIVFENYYEGEIIFNGELPVTTKDNKDYHGFGMKSIKMIVDKFSGYMTIKTENKKFILSILLRDI